MKIRLPMFLNSYVERIIEYLASKLSNNVLEAGIPLSPYRLSKVITCLTLSLLIALTVVSTFLMIFYGSTVFILLIPLCLLPIPVTFLWLWNSKDSRERRVSEELRYFLTYASLLHAGGLSLYDAFKRIIGKKLFPKLEEEAKLIVRNVEILGSDPLEALEEVARYNPSKSFRELIYGYTALAHSGGDLYKYLEDKAKHELKSLIEAYERYSMRTSVFGEIACSFLILFSMITCVSTVLSPQQLVEMLTLHIFILLPVMATLMFLTIHYTQPKIGFKFKNNLKYVLLGLGLSLPFTILVNDLVLQASITITSILACLGIKYAYEYRRVSRIEKDLLLFLRELVEYRKMGYTPFQALERILSHSQFSREFEKILLDIAFKVRMGFKPSDINVDSGSWLADFTFSILGDIEDCGGGTPALLEEIHGFIDKIIKVRRDVKASIRMYEMLAYASPVLITIAIAVSISLLKMLNRVHVDFIPLSTSIEHVVFWFKIMLVSSTLLLALLTDKIVEFSLKSGLRSSIVMGITTLCILMLNSIVNIVEDFLL